MEWELRASLDDPFFSSLQSSDPENWQLLHKLGGHFLIAALLAPNGNFPSLLLAEPILSLATDLFTGRLTLSLAQATTWINPLAILCSPLPPSSPISRQTMKAPSFYSLRLTTIPFMISKTPLGFQPPTTLPRSMTSTSPFSTNKTSLQPMRTT